MATTNFVDGITPVAAEWLNDVDAYVYEPAIYRDFNTNPGTIAAQAGRIHWDSVENALTADRGTDCHINLGQMQVLPPCQNTTGVTIPKGTFLMVTGVAADKLKVAPAVTNGTVDFKWMVGFALADIAAGSVDGCVITDGIIDNVNTQAWAVGTVLYPDPLVTGGLTSTQPAAPNYKAPIAIVTRQQLNNGRIYVRMQLPSRLGDTDSNVQFTGLANNDLVVYDSATTLWKNLPNTANKVTVADTGGNYTATDVEGVLAEAATKFALATSVVPATETVAGIVELATSAEVAAGTDTTRAITPAGLAASKIVAGTAIATTSGTAHDFTGIPSWVKKITVLVSGVSTTGTSPVIIQIGDSGGIEVTGYAAVGSGFAGTISSADFTAGFPFTESSLATNTISGSMNLYLLDAATNKWVAEAQIRRSAGVGGMGAGDKSLTTVLTQIRLTTVGGTDTFDAGSVNILYE